MLQWLHLNASHALAPVFRYHPDHSIKDCAYCAARMKSRVSHIKDHVPLEYQQEAIPSTSVTRFSLVINTSKDPHHAAYGKSVNDVFRNEFQCRINRLLDPASIIPTPDNIKSESGALTRLLKQGDHVLGYSFDDDVSTLFGKCDVSCSVWWVSTSSQPTDELTCLYKWLDGSLTSARSTGSTLSKTRIHILQPTSEDCESDFTERVLHVLQQSRYRISIVRLLQALGGRAVFRSNYPLNAKTTYFGFG